MAKNETLTLTAGVWNEITDADISSITFQNISPYPAFVTATSGATPSSTDPEDAIRYNPGQGERNVQLADLFPGVAGANRVFVYSNGVATVFVSHA